MLPPLTKRQKEILDYILDSVKKNGYAPSLQEIRDFFSLKAVSTVHEHLENLKNKGYIKKEMNQARGIQVQKNFTTNEYSKLKIRGIINKQKINFDTTPKKTLCVDSSLVAKNTKNYVLEVVDDSLSEQGLLSGDLCVVSETTETEGKNIILTSKFGVSKITTKDNIKGQVFAVVTGLIRNF